MQPKVSKVTLKELKQSTAQGEESVDKKETRLAFHKSASWKGRFHQEERCKKTKRGWEHCWDQNLTFAKNLSGLHMKCHVW